MTIAYRVAKAVDEMVASLSSDLERMSEYRCLACGKERSIGSARFCRQCYRDKAKLRKAQFAIQHEQMLRERLDLKEKKMNQSIFEDYRFVSLDALSYSHEQLKSHDLQPDEILMLKEENHEQ